MNDQREATLQKMISPGMPRVGKPMNGVIQIHITRTCDKACFGCTQGSNLGGKSEFITLGNFEQACLSLRNYFGIVGIFGGNPALHPEFPELCRILRQYIPMPRRGLWCNHPKGNGIHMRGTFNPAVSNLNVHMDQEAYNEFKRDWPKSNPFGLQKFSRHSPVYTAMQDLIPDEDERWRLISECDINQHWSAMVAQFRGELRGYFCEIAGAQSILHQYEEDYPDTGALVVCPNCNNTGKVETYRGEPSQGTEIVTCKFCKGRQWWEGTMDDFSQQVDFHCHGCGVPMRGYGELDQASEKSGVEQVTETHQGIYKPKRKERLVQLVINRNELKEQSLKKTTHYVQNADS